MEAIIVGSGFGGLSAAALLAKKDFSVTVIEKNEGPGGRASVYSEGGFTFDMGPSWYLMPDIFQRFFEEFGKKPEDFFELKRLDPSYKVFFDNEKTVSISADIEKIMSSSIALRRTGLKNSGITWNQQGNSMNPL